MQNFIKLCKYTAVFWIAREFLWAILYLYFVGCVSHSILCRYKSPLTLGPSLLIHWPSLQTGRRLSPLTFRPSSPIHGPSPSTTELSPPIDLWNESTDLYSLDWVLHPSDKRVHWSTDWFSDSTRGLSPFIIPPWNRARHSAVVGW